MEQSVFGLECSKNQFKNFNLAKIIFSFAITGEGFKIKTMGFF